jgi:hypothetical protein
MTLGQFGLTVVAAAVALFTIRVGVRMLKAVGTPLPGPPPDGEMRRISLRYRCSICGMEIRTVVAPESDPEPPRHCQDEMDLVAPVE